MLCAWVRLGVSPCNSIQQSVHKSRPPRLKHDTVRKTVSIPHMFLRGTHPTIRTTCSILQKTRGGAVISFNLVYPVLKSVFQALLRVAAHWQETSRRWLWRHVKQMVSAQSAEILHWTEFSHIYFRWPMHSILGQNGVNIFTSWFFQDYQNNCHV